MQNPAINKLAALSLIMALALTLAAMVYTPGNFIDPVDPLEVAEAVKTIGRHSTLAHIASTMGVLSAPFAIFGLFTFRRMIGHVGVGDGLARFGVLAIVVAAIIVVAGTGLNQMIAHLSVHSTLTGLSEDSMVSTAAAVQTVKLGILLVAGWISALGYFGLGLGMFIRLPASALKLYSLGATVAAGAGIVILLIAAHAETQLALYTVFQFLSIAIVFIWYILIINALFKGDGGFVVESE